METKDIIKLAEKHGLRLKDGISFNEMGIDFKVGFATDVDDKKWILRIPRRNDLAMQIETEKRILELASKYLSVEVPDWRIASSEFIAYPLLSDKPVLTFDAVTYDVTWNIDKDSPIYVTSLAKVLVDLHQIPAEDAQNLDLKISAPETFRKDVLDNLETVKSEFGIGKDLEKRWRRWLDNDRLWPDFSVFIHGDLYAGHVLATETDEVSGIIDWSEGQVSDPSIDFTGHINVFGEESLKELITQYEKLGGKVWDTLFDHIVERQAAAPLAYAMFSIKTKDEAHIAAVKTQLGVE